MSRQLNFSSEAEMLPPLIAWICKTAAPDILLAPEFRWFGRWIDLAALTQSAHTAAYELKLRNNPRAIDQAICNQLTFDRSYIVTATPPTEDGVSYAEQYGIGILLLEASEVTVLLEAKLHRTEAHLPLRGKLLGRLRERGVIGTYV